MRKTNEGYCANGNGKIFLKDRINIKELKNKNRTYYLYNLNSISTFHYLLSKHSLIAIAISYAKFTGTAFPIILYPTSTFLYINLKSSGNP